MITPERSEIIVPERSEERKSVKTITKWGREIVTTTRHWKNGNIKVVQETISGGYIPQQQIT